MTIASTFWVMKLSTQLACAVGSPVAPAALLGLQYTYFPPAASMPSLMPLSKATRLSSIGSLRGVQPTTHWVPFLGGCAAAPDAAADPAADAAADADGAADGAT